MHVLALNSGSSSLKFGMFRVGSSQVELLLCGEAEAIGAPEGRIHARDGRGEALRSDPGAIATQRDAVTRIEKLLTDTGSPLPDAIGHRIVHGGATLQQHCRIDSAVLQELEAASDFAPLHTPAAIAVIRFAQEHFPGLPEVACFDTAFHAGLPAVARTLPIPRALQAEGIRRYGFHGLSCESILHQLADRLPPRLIIAHLGNGASVTAVRAGESIDTSMGLTPTGGVIMGTRSGDLDPGVLIYLLRQKNLDATRLEELVDHRSGLLGISGVGSDMRRLHAAAAASADARLAIEMFCYSVRKQLAAMIAVLDGVDLLVFTGGIGENDWQARAAICSGLSWIGVSLDAVRNRAAGDRAAHDLATDGFISAPDSRCPVQVLASNEDEQIARHTWALVSRAD